MGVKESLGSQFNNICKIKRIRKFTNRGNKRLYMPIFSGVM
jgi:hypothetical protein